MAMIAEELSNIFQFGHLGIEKNDDVDGMIDFLFLAAQTHPSTLLVQLELANEAALHHMIMVGMAVLTAQAPEDWFVHGNIISCLNILSKYDAAALLQYTEYLKSKAFGRGLGSRPQKWIRLILESWRGNFFEQNLEKYPGDLASLVRLIHPKFQDYRANKIRNLLQNW